MRNLMQYPITLEEMIEAINWAVAKDREEWVAEGQPCGAIRGVALAQIRAELLDRKGGRGRLTEDAQNERSLILRWLRANADIMDVEAMILGIKRGKHRDIMT